MFWAFFQIFVLCDCGQHVTKKFIEVDNTIYQSDWYAFPDDVQRMLPIVMMGAQESVIIQGFGNLTCTREAFKKVSHSSRIQNRFLIYVDFRFRKVDSHTS